MKRIFAIFRTQTIKDSFLVFLGLATTAVLGFVYTIFMARLLAPESFGVFSALVSLVAITFSLGDLGIGPAIINFLPKHKESGQKIIETGYWFEYLAGVFIVMFFWIFSRYSDHLVPGSLPEQFALVGSLAFNYILISYAQSVFTAKRQFLRFSISQIIDATLKIILVFIFYRYGVLSISTALLANFISVVIALIFTFWTNLWQIKTKIDKQIFRQLFEYSKWIGISRFFSVFIGRIDIVLLNLISGSYQAGIFSAASRIALIFALIVSSLGSVINPRFSEFKSKTELKQYMNKLTIMISFICAVVLLTISLSDQIVSIVFGSEYRASSKLFQYLALSMLPFLYSVITTATLLYSFGETKFYAKITAIQVGIIIFVNLALIPNLGYYAPVAASSLANCFFLGASMNKLRHLFKNHPLAHQVVSQNTPQGV